MSDEIIEGDWDDLLRRHDLHGRKVRIVVIDEKEQGKPSTKGNAFDTDSWLKSLRVWAENHKPLGHVPDDGRDGIYSGTVDDPR